MIDPADPVSYPAPAKLNLFLHVTGRRADGYHLLQTVFCFIDRSDGLRFKLRPDGQILLTQPLPECRLIAICAIGRHICCKPQRVYGKALRFV